MGKGWNIWNCSVLRRPVTGVSYQCIKTPDGPRQTLLSSAQWQNMRQIKTQEIIPSDHKMEKENTLSTVRGVKHWNELCRKVIESSKPTQLDTVLDSLLWLTRPEQREIGLIDLKRCLPIQTILWLFWHGQTEKICFLSGLLKFCYTVIWAVLAIMKCRNHFREDAYPDVLVLCGHLVSCSAFPFTLVN